MVRRINDLECLVIKITLNLKIYEEALERVEQTGEETMEASTKDTNKKILKPSTFLN